MVDAVRCAIDVQSAMAGRNAGLSTDKRIEFRVGVHLGDVVEEADGDLMGDGVNIAARLEGIAEPGGICLSEDAWRQVRDKLKKAFVDLGEKALKNIARPMRVYAFASGSGARRPRRAFRRGKGLSLRACPSSCCPSPTSPRSRAGLFRRRRHREPDDRPFADIGLFRHRTQYRLHVQGQAHRCEGDRPRAQCALRARGQRSARRGQNAGQRPAHRLREWRALVGQRFISRSPTSSTCRTK